MTSAKVETRESRRSDLLPLKWLARNSSLKYASGETKCISLLKLLNYDPAKKLIHLTWWWCMGRVSAYGEARAAVLGSILGVP